MPFVDDTVTVGVDGDTRGARAAHNILPSHADEKGDGRRLRTGHRNKLLRTSRRRDQLRQRLLSQNQMTTIEKVDGSPTRSGHSAILVQPSPVIDCHLAIQTRQVRL